MFRPLSHTCHPNCCLYHKASPHPATSLDREDFSHAVTIRSLAVLRTTKAASRNIAQLAPSNIQCGRSPTAREVSRYRPSHRPTRLRSTSLQIYRRLCGINHTHCSEVSRIPAIRQIIYFFMQYFSTSECSRKYIIHVQFIVQVV